MRTLSTIPLALGLSLLPSGPAAQGGPSAAAGLLVVRPADADRDGAVSAAEWALFLGSLATDEAGTIDREDLKARLLAAQLDRDGDGRLSTDDLRLVLSRSGTDPDGRGGGRGGGRSSFADALVLAAADASGDGRVSAAESEGFLAALPAGADGTLASSVLLPWMARAEASVPADRNAFTPGIMLATLDASLDADGDGKLTRSDLEALFAGLDASGDGALDAAELSPRRLGPAAAAARATGGPENPWLVTDEMRARPPRMPWQRSLADALALAKATGKPLLVCVNMDGENASEGLAYGRYRDPDFAALASGFVPVLASPDRHEPRDRDDRGRRLPDPRFGRLVCQEHVDVEPELFRRWFGGTRVAPRHVGVAADGGVLFDLYLLNDPGQIDAKLRELGRPGPPAPDPATLDEEELFESPDAADRSELEARFVAAGEEDRVRLAGLALSDRRATQEVELVWLALRDPSRSVRLGGVEAIVAHAAKAAADQLPVAFRVAAARPDLRRGLAEAVARAAGDVAGENAQRDFAFWARAFEGLLAPSAVLDPERWSLALAAAPRITEEAPAAADLDPTTLLLERLQGACERAPEDVGLLDELSAVRVRLARIELAAGRDPSFFLTDAVSSCEAALHRAPDDARALGLRAWAAWLRSEQGAADLAARALPALLGRAGEPLVARVLEVLARGRAATLHAAIRAGEAWPAGTLADARAAYETLLVHPCADPRVWTEYLSLLDAVGGRAAQRELCLRALGRFPSSGDLHAWLRSIILRDEGAQALEALYAGDALATAQAADAADFDWFHGLALLVAAEWRIGNREPREALTDYQASRELFAASAQAKPGVGPSAMHYATLDLAGAARLLADAGKLDQAAADVLEAARIAPPQSLDTRDGFGKTPRELGRELAATLAARGRADLAERVRAALSEGDGVTSGEGG